VERYYAKRNNVTMAWVSVGPADMLRPGQGTAVMADGLDLALFNVEGEYFCIDNMCPHREGPLADGDLEDDVVICPWHAWQVSVRTGEVVYNPSMCVATHACRIENGEVQVEI
jgi:NAD(P)H-dependent nitrite reductase small subunit